MSPSQIDFLKHIQQELKFLVNHSENVTFEEFLNDGLINRAYLRSLEIIGEAAKKSRTKFAISIMRLIGVG
jgi:uncharacterized protein with HEPN domain